MVVMVDRPSIKEYRASTLLLLKAWKDFNFHADRMLSDMVLLSTGWTAELEENVNRHPLVAPEFPYHPQEKVRVTQARMVWKYGKNPQVLMWEPNHPDPVRSIDNAIAQLPFKWNVRMIERRPINGSFVDCKWYVLAIWTPEYIHQAPVESFLVEHVSLPVALSIAAIQAYQCEEDHKAANTPQANTDRS